MNFINRDKTKRGLFLILMIYVCFGIFRFAMDLLMTFLPNINAMDKALLYKVSFAAILGMVIWRMKLLSQCGLHRKVNWRLLPIYWPMAIIMLLILAGTTEPPAPLLLVKVIIFALAVAFAEEILFRGLVMHWFRHSAPRKIILISGASFGMMHLFGLTSELPPAVILAQVYFASGLGIIFAYARYRDYSIWLAIFVHWLFDVVAVGSKGGVTETFSNTEQAIMGLLLTGTIAWGWSLFLLNKAGKFKNH